MELLTIVGNGFEKIFATFFHCISNIVRVGLETIGVQWCNVLILRGSMFSRGFIIRCIFNLTTFPPAVLNADFFQTDLMIVIAVTGLLVCINFAIYTYYNCCILMGFKLY